ncbi:MAG: Gfo/Idh/MocA family oxidoreductase [Kiritimatiellae bacterium]|nr:Gfo/Idh/MocA family oxidoreductase [Kiritimatiellia bacterium]MDD5521428.1 Gfo/Idh/MocA family oxidoreductase [Kiritimatiellia bacterium]
MKTRITRRNFLSTAANAALFTIIPRYVLGGQGFTVPSEQLTKAVIGVGGMGRGHLTMGNAKLLAVCDTDEDRMKFAMEKGGKDVKGYRDFLEVLARPDIDIIHIATPPHWHGLISAMAAEAGKDIWCEKPMTRTIGEGKKVVEIVNRCGRIFRINTWFRFQSTFYGFGTNVVPIKKIVLSGMLGWPLKVIVNAGTGFNWKFGWSGLIDAKPEPVPPQLDYDLWLGPAPFKPYHHHRVHGTFRGYWDYDAGGLGDMGQHYLDPVQYILGKDDTSPVEVDVDAPPQHPDAASSWRRITMKYADGCTIILDGENRDKDAPFIEGPNGQVYPQLRSNIPNLLQRLRELPDPEPQATDFEDCVLKRRKFALNEINAHRSCTLVNIASSAVRLGRSLRFDPVAQQFIDDEEANRLVDQPMRAPWHF